MKVKAIFVSFFLYYSHNEVFIISYSLYSDILMRNDLEISDMF